MKKLLAFAATMLLMTATSNFATQDVGVNNYLSIINANETTPTSYANFFFYRSTPSTSGRIQFNLSWSGTSSVGDFTTLYSSVTLPNGWANGVLQIEVVNDASVEGTETLICTITSASNLDNPGETINVVDPDAGFYVYDDDLPTVFIQAQVNAKETPQTYGKVRFSRLTANASVALVVYYTLGGTATGPSPSMDFTLGVGTSTSVTIPAGNTYVDVDVIPWYDGYADSPETVTFTVSANAAYSIGGSSLATVTITDN